MKVIYIYKNKLGFFILENIENQKIFLTKIVVIFYFETTNIPTMTWFTI